jgi:hypothetical protein
VDYTASAHEVPDGRGLTGARIIFVPGLSPKPPPEIHEPQLRRVLHAALERTRPAAAQWLAANPDCFVLVSWTYLFYGVHRDIALDLPGIERLLARTKPTAAERREIASWSRRITRLTHLIGDMLPLLGRKLARPGIRLQMHDASRYLRDREGIGTAVRARLRAALEQAWTVGDRVLVIGHSLGSVVAYDTLWELSREPGGAERRVDLFVTMGSPLSTHFIRRRLRGTGFEGRQKYPTNIRHWVNLAARGDMTSLRPRLKPAFGAMLGLGLLESFDDYVDLDNFFRADFGLNTHEAYGYLAQPTLAKIVGDWLSRGA